MIVVRPITSDRWIPIGVRRLWPDMKLSPKSSSRLASALVSLALGAVAPAACDAEDDSMEASMDDSMSMQPESMCGEAEVVVSYVGTDNDRDECSSTPGVCDVDDPCFDDDCISALYDLCEEGTLGSACADFGGPVTVSCN